MRAVLERGGGVGLGGPMHSQIASLIQPFGFDGAGDVVWGLPAFSATNWLKTLNSGTYGVAADASGILQGTLTSNASSQSDTQLQESMDGGTTALIRFLPKAGTFIFASCSVKLSEVTTSGFMFGFNEINTAMLSTGTINTTDQLGFYKATGAATIVGNVRTSSTSTATATLATLAANTYVELGVLVDGISDVVFYVNGTPVGQTTMTNVPTAAMAMSMAYSANAKTAIFKNLYYGQFGLN
jgi:hypothetical protein